MRLLILACVVGLSFAAGARDSSHRLQNMEEILKDLVKQLVTQQFYVEERIRSDGDSGNLKTILTFNFVLNWHEKEKKPHPYVTFT